MPGLQQRSPCFASVPGHRTMRRVVQLVRIPACHAGVAGSSPVHLANDCKKSLAQTPGFCDAAGRHQPTKNPQSRSAASRTSARDRRLRSRPAAHSAPAAPFRRASRGSADRIAPANDQGRTARAVNCVVDRPQVDRLVQIHRPGEKARRSPVRPSPSCHRPVDEC